MAQTAFESLLKQSIGLEAGTIGGDSIERAVKRRMKELGLADSDAYLALVHESGEERSALVEEVVVPESWFFRNKEAFVVLQRFMLDEWCPAHPGGVLRVLSVPCSTGEEPYSIAMALMDAGLKPGRFHIDAVDVSRRALEKARLACYGKNSFRGKSLALCGHYFRETKTGFALQESVRKMVNFHQGNVLDRGFMEGLGSYDVIFFRNILIYFDDAGRSRIAKWIAAMLKDDGMFFVGHAEGGLMWQGVFTSARYRMAFAYRKFNDEQRVNRRTRKSHAAGKLSKPKRKARQERCLSPTKRSRASTGRRRNGCDGAEGPAPVKEEAEGTQTLEAAHELANLGRLQDAAAMCEANMRENGPSAQAHFILGLTCDREGGGAKAEAYFRKALYLNPDHYEALVHLALLVEQQGDVAAASRLKKRSRRVYEKGLGNGEPVRDGRE